MRGHPLPNTTQKKWFSSALLENQVSTICTKESAFFVIDLILSDTTSAYPLVVWDISKCTNYWNNFLTGFTWSREDVGVQVLLTLIVMIHFTIRLLPLFKSYPNYRLNRIHWVFLDFVSKIGNWLSSGGLLSVRISCFFASLAPTLFFPCQASKIKSSGGTSSFSKYLRAQIKHPKVF